MFLFRVHYIVLVSLIVFLGSAYFVFADRYEIVTPGFSGISADFRRMISDDGRYVVFPSTATNLVAGDTNGKEDIFIRDTLLDVTERVSISSDGTQGNAASREPSVSNDGRYVVFESDATNLVAGDTNGSTDVFVYDRTLDQIERVSVNDDQEEGDQNAHLPVISANGRYVAFLSLATNLIVGEVSNGQEHVYLYDRDLNTIEKIDVDVLGTEADQSALHVSISEDGRYIAFDSFASNLVAGYGGSTYNVFVKDRTTEEVEIISVNDADEEGGSVSRFPWISSDGRYVAFESFASNLVPGDTNTSADIFLKDRTLDTITRVSVNSSGIQGDGASLSPSVSNDGNFVLFHSYATNLITGDTNGSADIFLKNISTGEVTRIADLQTYSLISQDGNAILFPYGDGLVEGDTNGTIDLIVLFFEEESVEEPSSGGGASYGFRIPRVRIAENALSTDDRISLVDVTAPYTVDYFEVSTNENFVNAKKYRRAYTQNRISWDLCRGQIECLFGQKTVYVRFHLKSGKVFTRLDTIEYVMKDCPADVPQDLVVRNQSKNPQPILYRTIENVIQAQLPTNMFLRWGGLGLAKEFFTTLGSSAHLIKDC